MDSVKETVAFYDAISSDYARKWLTSDVMKKQQRFFVKNLNGNRVLDAGCGPGRDVLYFAGQGLSVVGIDLSEELLEIARDLVPNASFLKMDIRCLELPDQCCDGIWACASLLHVPKNQALQTLREFWRVLEPDGLLFLSIKEGEGESWKEHEEGRVFYSYYGEKEFKKLVEESGFSIIRFAKSVGHAIFFDVFARAKKDAIINR